MAVWNLNRTQVNMTLKYQNLIFSYAQGVLLNVIDIAAYMKYYNVDRPRSPNITSYYHEKYIFIESLRQNYKTGSRRGVGFDAKCLRYTKPAKWSKLLFRKRNLYCHLSKSVERSDTSF